MPTLTIDLQDVFERDRVIVRLGGRKVWSSNDVTTDMSCSLADRVELEVRDRPTTVEVALPSRGLSGRIDVDVASTPFLGVQLTELGDIRFELSDEPFVYF